MASLQDSRKQRKRGQIMTIEPSSHRMIPCCSTPTEASRGAWQSSPRKLWSDDRFRRDIHMSG